MENEEKNKVTGTGAIPPAGGLTTGATIPAAELGKKPEEVVVPPKKKIEVDPDVLQKVLDKVEKLEKENEIFREVVDKNRLTRVEELRSQGKLIKSVKLNMFDGKIIIGWKKVRDDVYLDEKSRLHEDQVVGLIFEGESTVGKELDIRSFSRLITKMSAEVIEEGKDKDGNVNFTVQTKDGKTIKIDSKFVN